MIREHGIEYGRGLVNRYAANNSTASSAKTAEKRCAAIQRLASLFKHTTQYVGLGTAEREVGSERARREGGEQLLTVQQADILDADPENH